MLRITLKAINAHKRRLLATCSAIVLGVAFLMGTLVMGDTTRAGFSDLFSEANAGTDAVVRSTVEVGDDDFSERALLDAALVDRIAAVDGVAVAEPLIEGTGQIVGADGDPLGGNGPPVVAGNWITDDGVNPYDLDQGRSPEAPGEVVIDRASAEEGDLHVGDTTTIRTPEPIPVTIVGLATFGAADSAGPLTYAAFTFDYAQQVLMPEPGRVSSVRVAAADGVSQAELVERLRPVLPDDVEAITGAALTAEQEDDIESDFLGFFQTFLLVFAGIALMVATFSIYNTFSILVAQRTRESALLRALGASRRQVIASMVVEALLVGIVASALGAAAGVGLASGLLALMNTAGFTLPTSGLLVGTASIVTAVAVGVVVTLLASVAPAIRASRVAPLAALRDVAVDRSGASLLRAAAGLLLTAVGAALTVAGTTGDGSLSQSGLGAVSCLVGVVVLGPVVARPAAAVLGGLLARRGMSGTLARRNAMRNPRRTAGTASALMVGVAVVTLFTVLAASVKASIDDTVSRQFAGDLIIASQNFSAGGQSPELAAAVSELPEVAVATGVGNAPMQVDGEGNVAAVIEPAEAERVMDLDVSAGTIGGLGDREIALYDAYARDHGLGMGDTVPVAFGDGTGDELTVGAIYDDNALMGDIIVPKAAWVPHAAARPTDVAVLVELADGVSAAEAEPAIQAVADRFAGPDVQDRGEYADAVSGEIDQALTIIYALLVMAIVIALMGIANTLSLSIHERVRELGLLRAVGQTRRQLRSMVRGESFVVALFGTVGGLGLGTFLGWAMVQAVAESDGLQAFAIPWTQLVVVVVLGAVVGIVAAVRPARRAARLDVLAAISAD